MQLLGAMSKTRVTGGLKLDLRSREKEILELHLGVAGREPQLGEVDHMQWPLLMTWTQIMVTGSVKRHRSCIWSRAGKGLPEETLSCKNWLWETFHPGNGWGPCQHLTQR